MVGLLTASTASGQLIFLPVLAKLTEVCGWRAALLLVCGATVVAALAVLALMRDRPQDLDLALYGERESRGMPHASGWGFADSLVAPVRVLGEAARTSVFWVLFAHILHVRAVTNGLIQTHFIPLCGDYGLAGYDRCRHVGAHGRVRFRRNAFAGLAVDRFDNRWLLFWYYGLRGLSLIYLPYSDFTIIGLTILPCFMDSTGLRRCRPRSSSPPSGSEPAKPTWCSAGSSQATSSALQPRRYGAGLTRTVYDTYLPAFLPLACSVSWRH